MKKTGERAEVSIVVRCPKKRPPLMVLRDARVCALSYSLVTYDLGKTQ